MLTWVLATVVTIGALAVGVRIVEPKLAFFPARGVDATPTDYGIAFTPVTIATADGERLRLWSMIHPHARATVVYFHGNGGNLSVWNPIVASVYRAGFTIHAVDYRGYGESSGRPSEQGLYRDADAVLGWLEQQQGTARPLIYWGRSLGSAVAAYAATVHAPDGIVIEAGFPDVRSLMRRSPPMSFLALFSSYRFATARHLSQTRVPVLVLHGDADRVVPYALGRELFENMREPKRFVTIRGGDHNDAEPADPATYWDAIQTFVASVARG